jgi:hypothetical protein
MSRTRMFGVIAALVACAGFATGCGGSGGYTAAEETPTTSAPAPEAPAAATPAAAATPGAESVIGQFDPADPKAAKDQTYAGYERFPKSRASKIFVDPTVKPVAPAPVSDGSTSGGTAPGGTTTTPQPSGPTDPLTPNPAPASLTASIDVNGVVEPATLGGAIPAATPQFTVKSITSTTVTLQLLSGTLPGGGTTIDLARDVPVTLNNQSTGANLTLTVKEIKASV